MKYLVNLIVLFSLLSNLAFADCDYSKIVKNLDGTYTYSKELHLCVGNMKQDLEVAQMQLSDLNKALELKDLALTKSDQRVTLWSNTSSDLESRLTKIDSEQKHNDFLYFGLGILSAVGVGLMTAKLIGR
jgi:hypothetical protein